LLIVVNSLPVLSLVAKSVGSIVLKSPAEALLLSELGLRSAGGSSKNYESKQGKPLN